MENKSEPHNGWNPPNILLIMSDQHNAGCLGAAGHPNVRTPNLDALSSRGTRMAAAYCNNPICGPSRSCFLSGQYVKTHGISGNDIRHLKTEAPNMARLFRENGYQTALIGKAHLPASWVEKGFEHVRFCDLCDADPEAPRSCHYFNDLIEAGFADYYDHGVLLPGHRGYNLQSFISNLPEGFSPEMWVGNEACSYLDSLDSARPFFAQISFQRPHDPYAPPPERADEYAVKDIELCPGAEDYLQKEFVGKPTFQQEYVSGPKGQGYPYRSRNTDDLRLQMARHFTLINMMDEAIGNILSLLEARGLLDNTIVVYHPDHGDFAGEHGLMLKNLGLYESVHRIPWIMAGPGVPAGKVHEGLIESVDLYPTLAELAGLSPEPEIDGVSRVHDLHSADASGKDVVVVEWDFYYKPQTRVYAARDRRYRLVIYDDVPDDGELYDHLNDPHELQNHFHDPAYQKEKRRLMEEINAYRCGARRVHTPQDDRDREHLFKNSPTVQIHRQGYCWSEICRKQSFAETV